ncbi:MAG TPA: hypothetical protein VMT79_13840 [Candidatus Binatia bacterium]|nr:hypothetical protein [Candidatus Binatia bacterium]
MGRHLRGGEASRLHHIFALLHQLIRALASGGEIAAADLVAKLGAKAETARELAYRLFTLCERKKRAADALAYNGAGAELAGDRAADPRGPQSRTHRARSVRR